MYPEVTPGQARTTLTSFDCFDKLTASKLTTSLT